MAKSAKKTAKKPEGVTVKVTGKASQAPAKVSVNGRMVELPTNQEVTVPDSVFEALKNSTDVAYEVINA